MQRSSHNRSSARDPGRSYDGWERNWYGQYRDSRFYDAYCPYCKEIHQVWCRERVETREGYRGYGWDCPITDRQFDLIYMGNWPHYEDEYGRPV